MKKPLTISVLKALALLGSLLLQISSFSQSVNLTGTVKNSNAVAIADVKLSLKNQPGFSATTSSSGNFTLSGIITGISVNEKVESISFENGLVEFRVKGEPVRIDVFSVTGRFVTTILNSNHMNGLFLINAAAYVPQDLNIYIIRVMIGEKVKSHKFMSSDSHAAKGITELSPNIQSVLKSEMAISDTLILTHKDYKTKKIFITSYTINLGTITMEVETAVPATPANLSATAASSSQINLSWTDNSNNEAGFRIERAPGGTTSFTEITTVGAGATSYQNTGLTASTSYVYRVRAYNSVGNSTYSNSSSATTHASTPTAPAAPTGLTATVISSTQINLSWKDNSNNETTFSIERAPGGTTSFTEIATAGANVTTYQNTGLTVSTSYTYRILAKNSAGNSGYSNSVSAKTKDQSLAIVRVQNNTKYDMTTIKFNNVEQLPSGFILPVGNSEDYTYTSGGTISYSITVGYIDANLKRTDFFVYNGTVQVVVGQTATINCVNPSLATILSDFSSSKNWTGYYFDANNNYHSCGYTFKSDGTYKLYDGTVLNETGSVTLVNWPDRSSIITFKIGNSESIEMIYPFASFMQNNGPASWKIITYTKQL